MPVYVAQCRETKVVKIGEAQSAIQRCQLLPVSFDLLGLCPFWASEDWAFSKIHYSPTAYGREYFLPSQKIYSFINEYVSPLVSHTWETAPDSLTIDDAALLVGKRPTTVMSWLYRGRLPFSKPDRRGKSPLIAKPDLYIFNSHNKS